MNASPTFSLQRTDSISGGRASSSTSLRESDWGVLSSHSLLGIEAEVSAIAGV